MLDGLAVQDFYGNVAVQAEMWGGSSVCESQPGIVFELSLKFPCRQWADAAPLAGERGEPSVLTGGFFTWPVFASSRAKFHFGGGTGTIPGVPAV